jgi:microcystin degradation protein MlrC
MAFAVVGIFHESNTFVGRGTRLDDFAILEGDAIRHHHAGSRSAIGGYLAAAEALGVEAVPLFLARATPSGTIESAAFDTLVERVVRSLATRAWDGILLAIHGAAVSEQFPDADGEILRRVRSAVGPRVPVVATLDMHANVSSTMVAASTALVAYRTNPHLDAADRAVDAARIAVAAARGEVRPVQARIAVPAVINMLRQNTDEEPLRTLVQHLERTVAEPGILSASVAQGFPYADVSDMGMSVLVVSDGDVRGAAQRADELAQLAWSVRDGFEGEATPIEAALARVEAAADGPTLLLDVGDNIGGGAPGDSVVLLREAIRRGIREIFSLVFAPDAVRRCEEHGVGSRVELSLGSPMPLEFTAVVRSVHDGRFEDPNPTHGGQTHFDAGRTVVIDLAEGGITLALTSRAIIPASPIQMTSLGLEPREYKAIILKGVNSPLAGYGRMAASTIFVDTPGCTAADLSHFVYRHRRRPMFPFERGALLETGTAAP